MVTRLDTLLQVADRFDVIVLDQWGVLHDGSQPYPTAPIVLKQLVGMGLRLAVLSNSGKRAAPNLDRITQMGFDPVWFQQVMTSGEALWRDVAAGRIKARRFFPIERTVGDAAIWADGLDLLLTDKVADADAILLMGLADAVPPDAARATLSAALDRDLPVYCTNPDRASPRAGGLRVISPGALAHDHVAAGGTVHFYGKPHAPVFRNLEAALGVAPDRLLMVGDSLEHDIAGGDEAGWSTAFVEGGLHADKFIAKRDPIAVIRSLAAGESAPLPTFTLPVLR